ncbi:MAG TPA: cytochrome c oxidase assembly protein [Ktedonobacterales bacterium]
MTPITLAQAAHTIKAVPNLWLAWTLDPTLLVGLAVILGGYLYAIGPARRRWGLGEAATRAQVAWFILGWLTLAVALISPLDTLGDGYLFSAHMIQHMLIAVVAPPMLLLGAPAWLAELPLRGAGLRRAARWLANPIFAFGVFQADIWLWHAPGLYDLTLENAAVHIVEHLSFLILGVIYWLPILSPTPLIPRISRGFAILYLFIGCQPMVALGALLTFAAAPLYAPYVAAPRVWGLSPLADQQLGGLIMWLPTNIPYLIALSAAFFLWVGERDRAERQAAGEFDFEVDSAAGQESTMREMTDAGATVIPPTAPAAD